MGGGYGEIERRRIVPCKSKDRGARAGTGLKPSVYAPHATAVALDRGALVDAGR